jgi:hypothetical protein
MSRIRGGSPGVQGMTMTAATKPSSGLRFHDASSARLPRIIGEV